MALTTLFWLAWSFTFAAVFAVAWIWLDERLGGATVLLYHRVRSHDAYQRLEGPDRNFSLPVERLREQLQWLKRSGFTFITPDQLYDFLDGQPLPSKAVLITFDDGCESVLRLALPELLAVEAPAVVFVTSDPEAWVFEDQRRLTAAEMIELCDHGLVVGGHGVSHHGLNEMSQEDLDKELADSRRSLATSVGSPVVDMAIPLNLYDYRTLLACRSAGYRMVFTANPGRVRRSHPPYELRRINVEGQMTLSEFQQSLTTGALVQRRVVAWLKRLPPRILGESRWMPIRKILFKSPFGRFLHYRYVRVVVGLVAFLWVLGLMSVALDVI